MRRITEEEANIRDINIGAIPIGKYINCSTKRKYKCVQCSEIYLCRPEHIQRNKQIYCAKCGHKNGGLSKRTNKEKIYKTVKQNGFQLVKYSYINNRAVVTVKCSCGNIFDTQLHSIIGGHVKSCGHCDDPKIGDRFGKLKVVIVFPYRSVGCKVVCECKCGRYTNILSASEIIRKDNKGLKSCGNCSLKRNGYYTSHVALNLHNIIEQLTNQEWKHNYFINGKCFDIVNPNLKIIIEYDGYYNHRVRRGDCATKDNKKLKMVIDRGWKVLHIKSNGRDYPTNQQLYKALIELQTFAKKRTITMPSWKLEKEKHENNRS